MPDKNYELTEHDRQFIVLALQGLAMRQGPEVFEAVVNLVRKIDGEQFLGEYLKDWIKHSRQGRKG